VKSPICGARFGKTVRNKARSRGSGRRAGYSLCFPPFGLLVSLAFGCRRRTRALPPIGRHRPAERLGRRGKAAVSAQVRDPFLNLVENPLASLTAAPSFDGQVASRRRGWACDVQAVEMLVMRSGQCELQSHCPPHQLGKSLPDQGSCRAYDAKSVPDAKSCRCCVVISDARTFRLRFCDVRA
jgi:hypothetical protein